MKELELFDRAMNVGYNMLLGKENTFEPTDSDEIEDMIFIPDPETSELEMAEDLLEYFESTYLNILNQLKNMKNVLILKLLLVI